jgi:lipopolysaccharide transport system ATP-binding protein
MSNIAVQVDQVSKRYRIGSLKKRGSKDTLTQAMAGLALAPMRNLQQLRRLSRFSSDVEEADNILWALRDVSFQIREGEAIGIIGRNGSGKSTLLKILSRITEPTTGHVMISGRVGSLLEVGTGFHPELTGRENVFLNGALLGMTRKEIARKFDEIVEFSGVEKFLDTPVKRYSSGMKVRLAFAVAAHLEPEILLIDEVLAVGDVEFQNKCLGKMDDVAHQGRTVVFVSHNLAAMTSFCQRMILLDGGAIQKVGSPQDVTVDYLGNMMKQSKLDLRYRTDRKGSGHLRITGIRFEDSAGHAIQHALTGQELRIVLSYEAAQRATQVSFGIGIQNMLGVPIFMCDTKLLGMSIREITGHGEVICHIPKLLLPSGQYWLNVDAVEGRGLIADYVEAAGTLEVVSGDFFGYGRVPSADAGIALLEHSWVLNVHSHNYNGTLKR